jgi:hypothetical protein
MKLSLLAMLLCPALALAQTVATDESDGLYGIEETWVTDPVLNLAACSTTAPEKVAVRLEIAAPPLLLLDESELLAWLDPDDTAACTGEVPEVTDADYVGGVTLTTDDPFLAGSDSIAVPDDLEDNAGETPVLTNLSVLTAQAACTGDGLETRLTLCFGLDENADGTIQTVGTGITAEAHAWVRLDIDTIAPPKPDTPAVTPLDGRLRLGVSISADGSKDDVAEWQARIRAQPTDAAAQTEPCDQWSAEETRTASATATGPESMTFTVGAANGETYQVCVRAVDAADNPGPFSDVAEGTPQVECDFAECYPPGLIEPGCSGAAPSTGALLVSLWVLCRRRAAQHRRKGE